MTNVLVRDIPAQVHTMLTARASRGWQSLQQYLQAELRNLAERPSLDEVLERIATRSGGSVGLAQAVADLDAVRDR